MKLLATMILAALAFTGCTKKMMEVNNIPANSTTTSTSANTGLRTYLALGDSYTIGESVEAAQNFPNQLKSQLGDVSNPTIIAHTGWTTDELIAAISSSDTRGKKYDMVTLLIGVNNQYRGYSKEVYRTEFIQLLNTAIEYAGGNNAHVFVISIPDWGVTPYAAWRDRNAIAAEIDAFNVINKQEAGKAGIAYVDITPVSKKAANDATLNAGDGLHPSAKMYSLWVEQILPVVKAGLKEQHYSSNHQP